MELTLTLVSTELKSTINNHLKKMYENSFPPEEREEWEKMISDLNKYSNENLKNNPYSCVLILMEIPENPLPIGFAYFYYFRNHRFWYMFYLAVDENFRSKGYGSQFMNSIKEYLQDICLKLNYESNIGIFYEIEKGDLPQYDAEKQKEISDRNRFYHKLDQKIVGTPYHQPPLRLEDPYLPMHLTVFPFKSEKKIQKSTVLNVYKSMYGYVYGLNDKEIDEYLKILKANLWEKEINLNSIL